MNTQELLEGGISELQARPWLKGILYDRETGGVCAAGAMARYMEKSGYLFHYGINKPDPWWEALQLLHAVCGMNIATYNNNVAESKEDVIEVFNKAIKLCADRP